MGKIILPSGVDAAYLKRGIVRIALPNEHPTAAIDRDADIPDFLSLVDHSRELDKDEYKRRLEEEQDRRDLLLRELPALRLALIEILEGRDAAGKTGTSKQLVGGVDFDIFDVVHVKAPNDEERKGPYWARFFDRGRLPNFGQLRLFDRSIYGELLVVPVDALASKAHVRLAYSQINTIEWLMHTSGYEIVKIWCDLTKKEQKKRFDERKAKANGKYQESDRKARAQWSQYTPFINKMFFYTGTEIAPWYVIPSDCKRFVRIASLELTNDAMEARIAAAKALLK